MFSLSLQLSLTSDDGIELTDISLIWNGPGINHIIDSAHGNQNKQMY